jgi:transposase
MNLQIQHVISDITGVTGAAIIDAILAGERDPATLVQLKQSGIRADEATLRKSLEGDWRQEHLFTLRQSRDMYQAYRQGIQECDREIAARLQRFEPRVDVQQKPLPARSGPSRKRKSKRTGDFRFDARQYSYELYGVDLTRIPGLEGLAIALFGEVGRDLKSRFHTAATFASWLGLCPDNDKTGGRVVWRGIRKIKSRAGQMFRLAASSLHHSRSPLGAFLRRMKAKLGPAAGITATAHKIAILFFTLITNQREYDESISAQRDRQRNQRLEQKVRRQAWKLGFELTPIPSAV